MTQPRNSSLPGDRFRIRSAHYSDAHPIFDDTGPTDRSDARVKLLKASDKAGVPAQRRLWSISRMAVVRLRSGMGSKTIERRYER
jgi:hypothetical protein